MRYGIDTVARTCSSGNDTYLYGKGAGHDSIMDCDYLPNNKDTIVLDSGFNQANTHLGRNGEDLVLAWDNNTNDALTISNYFTHSMYQIESIRFSNGSSWSVNDVMSNVEQRGAASMDFMFGVDDYSNRMSGMAGNDYLFGKSKNDVLSGGEGNDTLFGGAGADRFVFDTTVSTLNLDNIADFKTSEQDTIVLTSINFSQLMVGENLADHFRFSNQEVVGGDDYIVYNKNTGQLFYDATGHDQDLSSAIAFATLQNTPTDLNWQQFVVI